MEIGGLDNQPIQSVLQYGGSETKGEFAQMSNIIGAIALSDMVKTTLGPKGMDKILMTPSPVGQSQIEVTNDGATILKHLRPDNPAAKILIDISKTQDNEVGDGTTSVCVLAGELLREAEKLLQDNIHPQTIIDGYRQALGYAKEALLESSTDNKDDEEKFREDLMNIARTTISSKVLNHEKEHFAKLAVDAVMRLKGSTNLDQIKIIKKAGGNMKDSYLDEGFIMEKSFGVGGPKRVENAKILLADTGMDTDKIKINGVIRTSSMKTLSQIELAEKEKMKKKCENIIAHNCNLFINRQLIYDYPMELFAEKGLAAIEHADFEGIERLALVLGGDIVSTFTSPDAVTLGECDLVEEIMIGEDKLIKFSGCKRNEACTIVLRGASTHLLEEAERSLHDALCVLSQTVGNTRTVLGGGCSEMVMAKAIQDRSKTIGGKKKLACEAFARALKQIPHIIASNAGLDSADIVAALEAEHYKGNKTTGLDMNKGEVGDVAKLGILEAYKSKYSSVISATEAASMIIKIDSIVTTQPRQRRG
mmetsp:Transcript_9938/g.14643  ORF Transcript_9938/g.14643 Transcript_9938/m.14643 type:complete len:535 (-) Transcript_9938:2906-4510(-)|eukprot:CAMPEP_0117420444 /NCGR_PEP_ID=MMETSP0758-20121206/1774_1 /TAXON_ID=63605 /ORGANISM="Percolomonas cosmopolitus, Strain AE-1 (ATCC 50343)" /LENGTH=534 /DNA_ID=CAMNT_0005202051 /DNA_START=40 /DNA_END=1644 /DNA_ORIENTATION=-